MSAGAIVLGVVLLLTTRGGSSPSVGSASTGARAIDAKDVAACMAVRQFVVVDLDVQRSDEERDHHRRAAALDAVEDAGFDTWHPVLSQLGALATDLKHGGPQTRHERNDRLRAVFRACDALGQPALSGTEEEYFCRVAPPAFKHEECGGLQSG